MKIFNSSKGDVKETQINEKMLNVEDINLFGDHK